MSYTTSLFTDCLTSTNDINFNIILSAFSIGDIVSYDSGSGARCYYLESFTGASSGVTNFDTPEFMSGQCESCITEYCDSMVPYYFVSCCTNDLENLITYGIYLPNFSAGTEVIVDPDSGDYYHMFSPSSRSYDYCFETPNYDSCLDAYTSNNRLPQCESVIVRRAFNCCSGESVQQIFVATNLESGDTFSFSSQCWTVGVTASTTPIALISSGETTYSSCTDCSNQTKFMYNISNCNTSFGYKWVCMDQELITGQTYQMNVTIGSGGTFSATCFYVIAREEDCESCLTYNNSGTVLSGPFTDCGICISGSTPTPSVTPTVTSTKTPTPSVTSTVTSTSGLTPSVTPTKTRTPAKTPFQTSTPTKSITPNPTNTRTPNPTNTGTPTPTKTRTPAKTPFQTSTPTKSITPNPTNTRTPNPTPTRTTTPTKTRTPAKTPFQTLTPTKSITPTQTKTRTPAPTNTITPNPTNTRTPAKTPFQTRTPTKTITPTPTNTRTPTKSITPTLTNTTTLTNTITPNPTNTITPTN